MISIKILAQVNIVNIILLSPLALILILLAVDYSVANILILHFNHISSSVFLPIFFFILLTANTRTSVTSFSLFSCKCRLD